MRVYALFAVAAVSVGTLLTYALRRGFPTTDLYAEVQWDPYPYSYAFRG